MRAKTDPDVQGADLTGGKAVSRLRMASVATAALGVISLLGGILTGNWQPFAVLVALVLLIVISWLWSVAVDRMYHRLRHWNKEQAPQPVTQAGMRAQAAVRHPLRPVTSGPAMLSLKGLVEAGYVPAVRTSAGSDDPDERVEALKMESAQSLARLAKEMDSAGRAEDAAKIWREAAELDASGEAAAHVTGSVPGTAGSALSSALSLLRNKQYQEARTALAKAGHSGAALYGLGVACGALGMADKAVDAFTKAAQAGAECAELRLALGAAMAERGDAQGAIKQFRAAVTMDSDLGAAYAALGDTLILTGDLSNARVALEEALSIDASVPLARAALGRLLYEKRDAAGAAREFGRALESDPDNPALKYNQAAALLAAGRSGEAAAILENLPGRESDAQATSLLADAYDKKGDKEKAREMLSKALELTPESTDARIKLARSLRADGKLAQARDAAEEVLQDNPRSAEALCEMGLIEEASGETEKALQHLRAAAQADRGLADAITGAGRILVKQRQYKEAAVLLKQGLGLQNASADMHFWYGEAQLRAGKALLAMTALRTAATLAGAPRGDISYSLGRAMLQAGRTKEATDELRRAHKLLPGNHEVERDLGFALHKTRNYQEALRCFRAYLEAAPDAADAAEIRRLADELAV